MTDTCDATTSGGGTCELPAGWGTDHTGSGRCKHHGGASSGGQREGAGAPENNDNAQRHALHAHRGKFYRRLSDEKQRRVDEIESALIDRYQERHGTQPDAAAVQDLFEIAVSHAQREYARDWMAEHAEETDGNPMAEQRVIGQRDDGSPITVTVPTEWTDQLEASRREDRLMKKHMGLFRDPETQQAEATRTLAEVLDE